MCLILRLFNGVPRPAKFRGERWCREGKGRAGDEMDIMLFRSLEKLRVESNPGNPRGFECSLIQLSSEEIQLYSIDVLVQRNLFGRRVQALSSFRSLL